MKKILLTCILSFLVFAIHANNVKLVETEKCGTDILHQQKLANDPSYANRLAEIEAHTQQVIQAAQNNKTANLEVITIPVVFHVLYNNSAENVGEEQLLSQLQVLNEDFRLQNSNINTLPSYFEGLEADVEIEFCLAQSTPEGLPFDGITRTQTNLGTFAYGDTQPAKFTALGGKDAWPRDQYLNFWVCDLSAGLLGYAQFPGEAADTDGIVVDYRYTGRIGNIATGVQGRTATHEIGHWLNLRHIWGDGDCSADDFVSDTPTADGSNYGCLVGSDSCNDGVNDLPDMVQNYMDYSDDSCMALFTLGQKERMRALFVGAGARANLAQSTACILPTLGANDAKLVEISNPIADQNYCDDQVPTTIRIRNFGSDNLTSLTVQTTVDGNVVSNFDWTGNLSTGDSENVPLGIITLSQGIHNIEFELTNVNGGTDVNLADNTADLTVQVEGRPLPIQESFEEVTFPPVFYDVKNYDEERSWQTTNDAAHSGSQSMVIRNFVYGETGAVDDFITPIIDLTGINQPQLEFYNAYARYNSDDTDTLEVLVSADCGETYTSVWKKYGILMATAGNTTSEFVPNENQWKQNIIDLSDYANQSQVMVKFSAINSYENNLYVDDINITNDGEMVGINELSLIHDLNIYPNPTSDFLNIIVSNESLKDAEISLTNLNGQELLRFNNIQLNTNEAFKINCSQLSSGLYIVKIKTENSFYHQKISILD